MFTQTWTTSFKQQVLLGQHDLETDALRIALYTPDATVGPNTTQYSTTNEVVGTGYTAGGQLLVNVTVNAGNGIAYVSFDNPLWAGTTFTTLGALIYNATNSDKSIAVLNFGTEQTTVNQTFEIMLPANNPTFAFMQLR
jgi:hypothetical protein